jgi:hypothetical protein
MSGAVPFVLTDLAGRPRRLGELCADGPLLLAFVERDCPTSVATLQAIAPVGARLAVVSEGSPEAARDLAARAKLVDTPVLVESAPYPVSAAYGLQTVPTLVLVSPTGEEWDRTEGWDAEAVRRLVAAAGGRVGEITTGLPASKPGCQARNTYDEATGLRLEVEDRALAADDGPSSSGGDVDEMWRRGWHDGLPVVPPTRERVDAMLGGRDPDEPIGEVPPAMGLLTMERLAACAVLAGCSPEYFPVVLAVAHAALDPAFNLHGMQNTTHPASPAVVVNGPVAERIGMNGGSNALGFGNRANATIGRALRLVMALTGGGTPGGLDQSTLGGPHKWTLCFPEREAASPWQPLHVDKGFAPEQSVVSLYCTEGPAMISDHYSRTPDQLAATLALGLGSVWAPAWYPMAAETVLVLCVEHARTFADAGWSKERLREQLFDLSRRTVGELKASGSGELTPLITYARDDDAVVSKFLQPEEIVIVVAGSDAGRFSAVLAPWAGFGLGSTPVTRLIEEA